ncbi:MAG: zinc ribbon domain-containing protein [Clostridia bacterium]|nr:zinc ribbon domain-containing protein [Clostridia bacterium]
MAETRVFKLLNGVTVEMLGEAVECFLRDQKGMITQAGQTTEGYLVQGKQEADIWKKFSGTDQAITVQMFKAGDILNVTCGFGKWSDKIGAGFVGTFVAFAPLAITAAIGAYRQKKLPSEIFDYMEKFILSGGQSASVGLSGGKMISDNEVVCPNCKTSNPKGQKFCNNCGSKLMKQCPNCGANIADGIKFCPECGASTFVEHNCPNCGTEYKEGQKFCLECGQSLLQLEGE